MRTGGSPRRRYRCENPTSPLYYTSEKTHGKISVYVGHFRKGKIKRTDQKKRREMRNYRATSRTTTTAGTARRDVKKRFLVYTGGPVALAKNSRRQRCTIGQETPFR
mmetsp:Transcript_39750/g.77669  ORF Transcript_39750/g.77669 Transcript_39750/m.77669 type:complete len:107 (+) Transcript_39750:259-579(+)